MDFFISAAHAQGAPAAGPGLLGSLLLPAILLASIYFLIMRPQQKRVKEHGAMVAALKKGDEVVTNGGLGGTIVKTGDAYLTVRIAEGVEVNVQKGAVAALLPSGTLKTI